MQASCRIFARRFAGNRRGGCVIFGKRRRACKPGAFPTFSGQSADGHPLRRHCNSGSRTPMAHPGKPHDASAQGWSGRFAEPVTEAVKRFTASVDFDRRLAQVDIAGSLAHARMLAAVGVLSHEDLDAIEAGMATIRGEIERGAFTWSRDLEDVHLNLEKRLMALAGDAGKRLHTARSRNDQVATDLRLWLRDAIDALASRLAGLRRAFIDLAERHADTIMPGFTHLQIAQPVTFGHHLLAYEAMFARDAERLADCRKRVNRLPLGSAALAGTSYPIDREMVARELGFE